MTPGSHRQGALVEGFGGAFASSRHVVVSVSRDLAGSQFGSQFAPVRDTPAAVVAGIYVNGRVHNLKASVPRDTGVRIPPLSPPLTIRWSIALEPFTIRRKEPAKSPD
jgi:hypothetical protein